MNYHHLALAWQATCKTYPRQLKKTLPRNFNYLFVLFVNRYPYIIRLIFTCLYQTRHPLNAKLIFLNLLRRI